MTGADQVTEAGQPGSPGIVCLSDGLAVTSQPVVVAYGGGTNSTALLVGMLERGERPDLILFADTGGEKPGTYTHTATVSDWCESVGFPRIETVRYANKAGQVITLYDKCISAKMLPSIAYGFKSCSEKWKRRPQDRYVSQWAPAQAAPKPRFARYLQSCKTWPWRWKTTPNLQPLQAWAGASRGAM